MITGPYLEFRNVCKTFPGVKALDNVSFSVNQGSVHALVGENGAGKSTLLKILSGAYIPTSGTICINGKEHSFQSTSEAIAAGIAVIYQELHLAPDMNVAENLYLGHLFSRYGIVDRKKLFSETRKLLDDLGENIPPGKRLGDLPIGQRQMVEIAKALSRGAKVIAFDEPTSSLSDREISKLFAIIRDLRSKGHVIVYVSHRMDEIFEICDAVTVFRDGRHVYTCESMAEISRDQLVQYMVGRDIHDIYNYRGRSHGKEILRVKQLTGPGLAEPVSLQLKKGEITGIFGLVGAGRTELLKCIYGAVPGVKGDISVDGRPVRIGSPHDSVANGIMFCPEDRKKEGIVPVRSVLENINISARRRNNRMGFIIDERWEAKNCRTQIDKLSIKTPSSHQLIMNLSGGNQQKVILGRWLSERIVVLLLDEPTRGIDVGAKNEIYSIMYGLAEGGVGIIFVSSELPEVLGVADRVLVMREGRIAAQFDRGTATPDAVLKNALPASKEITAENQN
jgi:L-arabinose transport system ATP-binding protein